MEICCGLLLLPLLQVIVVLADNTDPNTTERHVKTTGPNFILHRLWKREISCPLDEYHSGTHCCKLCNAGTYAESDCSVDHSNPQCKDCINGVTYMDINNGLDKCHTCLKCDPEQGQEMLQACTVSKNTVCRCSEHFFCTENRTKESNDCMHCKHCTTCEHGYAETCTATKDAVCKRPRHRYFLIPAFLVIVCCWSLALCSNTKKHTQSDVKPLRTTYEVPDIDIEGYLQAFADKMDLNTVIWVVRKMGLSDTVIDDKQNEHVNKCNEHKYQLLKAWLVSHGRNGAFPDLIRTLQDNQKQLIVEQLIQITGGQGQQSQG